MNRLVSALSVASLLSLLGAPCLAGEPTLETFQGVWQVEVIEFQDYEVRRTSNPVTLSFSPGKVVTTWPFKVEVMNRMTLGTSGNYTETTWGFTFSDRPRNDKFMLDLLSSPCRIDLEETRGSTVELKKGICRLTETGLEICIARPGQNRPTEFKSAATTVLMHLKRPPSARRVASID